MDTKLLLHAIQRTGNFESLLSRRFAGVTLKQYEEKRKVGAIHIQGDTSHCSQPPVDIKTKVPFQNEAHVLKRKICYYANGRFDTI